MSNPRLPNLKSSHAVDFSISALLSLETAAADDLLNELWARGGEKDREIDGAVFATRYVISRRAHSGRGLVHKRRKDDRLHLLLRFSVGAPKADPDLGKIETLLVVLNERKIQTELHSRATFVFPGSFFSSFFAMPLKLFDDRATFDHLTGFRLSKMEQGESVRDVILDHTGDPKKLQLSVSWRKVDSLSSASPVELFQEAKQQAAAVLAPRSEVNRWIRKQ